MKYLHCPHCVESGQRGVYDVAVSEKGDLEVSCIDHELHNGGAFLTLDNHNIAMKLREIGGASCTECGGKCNGGVH